MPELTTNSDLIPAARIEDGCLIATVRGEIDLHNSSEMRDVLLDTLNKHTLKRIVLNLGQVSYMDSSAVAVLVEALQKIRKTGGKICLTDLQPRVKGLLEIARLDTIFVIAANEQEAMTRS